MKKNEKQLKTAGTFQYFQKAAQILCLNRSSMAEIATDRQCLRFGLAVAACGGAMTVIPRGDVKTFIFFGLYSVASLFLFAGFVHLLAGYTKGKQHYMGFVRISALASILDWLATVPFLALLIVFWGIAVAVVATEEIYELTRGKAVLTVLAAVSTLWVVTLLLFTGPFAPFYESLGAP